MSNASDEATNLSELAEQVKDLRAVAEQAVENYQALLRENASLTARAVRAEEAVASIVSQWDAVLPEPEWYDGMVKTVLAARRAMDTPGPATP